MRCGCTVCIAVIIDQGLAIFVGNNNISIILVGTDKGFGIITFIGLEYDLLHFLDVGGLLCLVDFFFSRVPPLPSMSGIVATSIPRFVFAGDFLKVAHCLIMPVVSTVVALLLKSGAFIHRVASYVAKFAEGGCGGCVSGGEIPSWLLGNTACE
jgi:hypothetical protein